MREPPGHIFLRFLRFGLLAWGGPAAQIAMIRRECVEELGWLDDEEFAKTLAVYQVLPGPEAHELCVHLGVLRGGRLGGFLAGLGFMLPGFVLMVAASALYVEVGIDQDLFYGLQAAVAALVAMAVVRLSRAFVTDLALALLAVAAFAATLFLDAPFLLVLAAGGLLYWGWRRLPRGGALSLSPGTLAFMLVLAVSLPLGAELFLEGLKTGMLTFGGAYSAVPLLQQSAVEGHGWLTQDQLVDGLAISGILPAPLIIFATFIGHLAGGVGGALLITVGVFLPAFVFPLFLHRQLVAASADERLRPFLLGVTAAVVGLIAAVTVDLLDASVPDAPSALLALGAFAVLYRWPGKLIVLWVVLGCGAIGALLQLTVL
jgi:chromate transporter